MNRNQIDKLRQEVLVLRAQLGDTESFTRLVERYHNRVLYYVRRLVADVASVEDVLQETWLTAYQKLPRLSQPTSFGPWLYGIARHKALQQLRHRGWVTAPSGVFSELIDEGEPLEIPPDDLKRMHACLCRLSLEHREVLTLRFLEGMSYCRIASVIGCKVGTVRSRLHYAKSALKREMEEDHDEREEQPG